MTMPILEDDPAQYMESAEDLPEKRGNCVMKKCLIFGIILVGFWMTVSQAVIPADDIIVILKGGQSIAKVNHDTGTHTIRQVPGQLVYLVQADNGGSTGSLQRLLHNQAVDAAEVNRPMRLNSGPAPTLADTGLVQSMAALLDGQTRKSFYGTSVLKAYIDQPALQIIGVEGVRNISTGTGTRIAYLDTGVDLDHPALRPWLDPGIDLIGSGTVSEFDGLPQQISDWLNQNNTSQLDNRLAFLLVQSMAALLDDDSGESYTSIPPGFGHGTLVAGVLHVVAPLARIVPIRAFDVYGNTTMFTIIDGMYRASDLGVDVLNMSFSTTAESEALRRATLYAQGRGVTLVASAGNDSHDADGTYPAAYPLVVCVAATDFHDRLADFSNYGFVVTVTAPGAYVVSTVPGGRYAMAWGTSFSAPVVSGSIALVNSIYPNGDANRNYVITTAQTIDDENPGYERQIGKGRVYLPNAFQRGKH